jgi:hypothetical protein
MRVVKKQLCLALIIASVGGASQAALAQSTAFTYQGLLQSNNIVAQGLYDARFRLYDAQTGGNQIGSVLCVDNVAVARGAFTALLDFGTAFNGPARYLEIDVRADQGLGCASSTGFVTLGPRQLIGAAPQATNANNASTLSGLSSSFYLNASNLSSGTLPDERLSTNIATLSSPQTVTGAKTYSTAPAFTSAGAPFSVSTQTRVTNLNADLLDGLSSADCAPSTHTHDASVIVAGTLADARLSTNVPRLASANTFTAAQTLNVGGSQTPLTLLGSNNQGTWLTIGNTLARNWNIIASSTSNGEGAGKLVFRDSTASAVRMTIDTDGDVGIGTSFPAGKLDVTGADAKVAIRNSNDVGGGFVQNTFGALQFGLYNPTASAWNAVPANGQRSMFGVESTGRVGSLTNTGSAPAFRNWLDDGNGNASVQGTIAARNLPAVKVVSNPISISQFSRDSRTLIETIPINVPASGFLIITGRADVSNQWSASGLGESIAILELKETTSAEVLVAESKFEQGGQGDPVSFRTVKTEMSVEYVTAVSAGAKSYKLRIRHDGQNAGVGGLTLNGSAKVTVIYVPGGL